MSRLFIFLLFSCLSSSIFGQFDTIGGSFTGTLGLTNSKDFVFTLSYNNFGVNQVRAYSGNQLNDPGLLVFSESATTLTDLKFHQRNLYVAATKTPIIQGSVIYKIEDPTESNVESSILLEPPFPISAIAFRDDMLYMVRIDLFGGGIFSFDTSDPNAELELFVDEDFSNFDQQMIVEGNHLLIAVDDKVMSIDLLADSPRPTVLINDLDGPRGITVDDGRLYVTIANCSSNRSSEINIYPYENGTVGSLLESIGRNTALKLAAVARLANGTYLLEVAIRQQTAPGYLLRLETTNATRLLNEVKKVTVFPNPTRNWASVQGEIILDATAIDGSGRTIILPPPANNRIDLSNLPAGNYGLLIRLENGLHYARVMVQ